MKPHVRYQTPDFRIVRVQLTEKQREPKEPGKPEDDGLRDLIEVADSYDLLGTPRWQRLDKKAEGVGTYDRICHAMKRELLQLLDQLKEPEHASTE
jgi:hypothetical protein